MSDPPRDPCADVVCQHVPRHDFRAFPMTSDPIAKLDGLIEEGEVWCRARDVRVLMSGVVAARCHDEDCVIHAYAPDEADEADSVAGFAALERRHPMTSDPTRDALAAADRLAEAVLTWQTGHQVEARAHEYRQARALSTTPAPDLDAMTEAVLLAFPTSDGAGWEQFPSSRQWAESKARAIRAALEGATP